jgi:class 3 adenylate cyclase
MTLQTELESWVSTVFKTNWELRDGQKVPDDDSRLSLQNEAIQIEGAVLYSDMADSTRLVDTQKPHFAAEIYKTFLYCAAKCIRAEGGVITAYDGDRIMGVFIGDRMCTRASRAALKTRWAEHEIIRPKLKEQYPNIPYVPAHVTGIDVSPLFVAKTGVRGANDLVWVGRAANYAAKLSSLESGYTYLTDRVYDRMATDIKTYNNNSVWEATTWPWNQARIYRSNWRWALD